VKATCKELKFKIRDKSDKTDYHLSSANNSKDNICQSVYTQPPSSSSSSSNASSPANSSDMNILQEIEGILNASNSTNGSGSKKKEDFNLIDFGEDVNGTREVSRRNIVDPFECADGGGGNSDLLNDVIKELDKSTSITRQNWTKFD
jgi:hypothetical protein